LSKAPTFHDAHEHAHGLDTIHLRAPQDEGLFSLIKL
jgi:hypothetical protein